MARAIETPVEILNACLATKADLLLRRDIAAGAKLDIDGTPTFIIQGETFTGELPAEVRSAFSL